MIEFEGKNGLVKIFTDLVEDQAVQQVKEMADSKITENTVMRIMPDVHYGKGSTVGTTIKLSENFDEWNVSPNVVGSDVGCGILMYKIGEKEIDFEKLDKVVNKLVPSGPNKHKYPQDLKFTQNAIASLSFQLKNYSIDNITLSLGTLGDGNHFIELGVDKEGSYWLSVHSGSRNLGAQVARHHQKKAISELVSNKNEIEDIILKLKEQGQFKEIQNAILEHKAKNPQVTTRDKELASLSGENLKDYLRDMMIAQEFAHRSRVVMLDIITKAMGFTVVDSFDSVHNFIEQKDFKDGVIRKGATSAKLGERLVIPLNMRDGSIIARGKGNKDWNESAPHGAGRLLSRSKAFKTIDFEDYKKSMQFVHTSSVNSLTIDEAPKAYKPARAIINNIADTVDIIDIIKPVYNFKAH